METKTYYVALFSHFRNAAELARAIASELSCQAQIKRSKLYGKFAVIAPQTAKLEIENSELLTSLAAGDFDYDEDDLDRFVADEWYQEDVEWRVARHDWEQEVSVNEDRIARMGDEADDFIE